MIATIAVLLILNVIVFHWACYWLDKTTRPSITRTEMFWVMAAFVTLPLLVMLISIEVLP